MPLIGRRDEAPTAEPATRMAQVAEPRAFAPQPAEPRAFAPQGEEPRAFVPQPAEPLGFAPQAPGPTAPVEAVTAAADYELPIDSLVAVAASRLGSTAPRSCRAPLNSRWLANWWRILRGV